MCTSSIPPVGLANCTGLIPNIAWCCDKI
jgi:hypothetical protein